MRILCRSIIMQPQLEALAREGGADVVVAPDAPTALREASDVDALWLWPGCYDADLAAALGQSRRLRWIQLLTMGYDPLEALGVPAGVLVTNAGDAYAPTVAEHALGLLLALLRQIPQALERAARPIWDPTLAGGVGTLNDAAVAVLGFGSIGREIAVRLHACGARVIAVTRSGAEHQLADENVPVSALHAVLERVDALVVAAPLTPLTRGLIDAAALAAMRPSAILINIARGGIVDTIALTEALLGGRLAGAGLDVTDPEPLPPNHPLWSAPNVLITPHIAGYGGTVPGRRVGALIRRNLDAFLNGRPLEAQIDVAVAR
jgi:phosphoglycerate dehydrogenase-like enzyme